MNIKKIRLSQLEELIYTNEEKMKEVLVIQKMLANAGARLTKYLMDNNEIKYMALPYEIDSAIDELKDDKKELLLENQELQKLIRDEK